MVAGLSSLKSTLCPVPSLFCSHILFIIMCHWTLESGNEQHVTIKSFALKQNISNPPNVFFHSVAKVTRTVSIKLTNHITNYKECKQPKLIESSIIGLKTINAKQTWKGKVP